jgi:hypothetical protein
MPLLKRSDLLAKEKVKITKVELGEDKYVFVRQMSGRERDHFEQSLIKTTKNAKGQTETIEQSLEDFRAKLAVAVLCDEEGNMLLGPHDIATLSQNMSAVSLDRIVTEAQRINSITEEDKEELIKNSVVGQADSSTSSSASV